MGRRRQESPALDAAIAEARRTGLPTEEVAARHGVAARTLRRRLGEKPRAARAAKKAPAPKALPAKPRKPAQEAEDDIATDEDTLVVARRMLRRLERDYKTGENGREKSGLAEKVLGAIGRIEQILARRPAPPRPDAVLEELNRLGLDAIARVEEHLPDPVRPEEIT